MTDLLHKLVSAVIGGALIALAGWLGAQRRERKTRAQAAGSAAAGAVTAGQYAPAKPRRPGAAALLTLAAVTTGALVAAVSCSSGSPSSATNPVAAASNSYQGSGGSTDIPTPGPSTSPTGTDTGSGTGSGGADSGTGSGAYGGTATTPTAAASPYRTGTCLNGTLPDSTTAQEVNDVSEVDCSASDAHYRVIQTFYETTDLRQCDSNPGTQYAFSAKETWGGSVINQYVYCLIGLGSYAR